MENIQPWCISRQLWWGHQIPAWYGPDGKIFVAETEDDAVADALAHYTDIEEITVQDGHDIAADPERRSRFANEFLKRDEDVLDTWFSSALWPFSTLGWPDQTPELARFYPTSALVTGFDIIFFWVARMMMMGLHFMRTVPFRTVYIHALVRDASRRQDVEVERQRHRPARPHRPIRRRRAALHARGDGGAGPRHQARPRSASRAIAISRPSSGTPRASPRSTAARTIADFSRAPCQGNAQPLDRARDRQGGARRHRGDRSLQVQRRGRARSTASSGTSSATGISN